MVEEPDYSEPSDSSFYGRKKPRKPIQAASTGFRLRRSYWLSGVLLILCFIAGTALWWGKIGGPGRVVGETRLLQLEAGADVAELKRKPINTGGQVVWIHLIPSQPREKEE